MPGPPPSEDRIRRNKDPHETLYVSNDDQIRGYPLPESQDWCETTIEWWEAWRSSPQAQRMIDTDWWELLTSAFIHNRIWDPEIEVAARDLAALLTELRQRMTSFGATMADRQKLRMQIVAPPDPDAVEAAQGRKVVYDAEKLLKKAVKG